MHKTLQFFLCLLSPFVVGAISGIATANNINNWYANLIKPSFNPPNYLFGPVWTLLYLLMGISFYLILNSSTKTKRASAIRLFWIQLFLNFIWSFLFFQFHFLGLALIEIGLMWLSILLMITSFYTLNKTAALLQLPYLLWVSFASLLNASIWFLNNKP
jgi:benzodiazapine receptor